MEHLGWAQSVRRCPLFFSKLNAVGLGREAIDLVPCLTNLLVCGIWSLACLLPLCSKKIQNTYSFVAVMALNSWFAAGPVHV
jgi:hypothetical protein